MRALRLIDIAQGTRCSALQRVCDSFYILCVFTGHEQFRTGLEFVFRDLTQRLPWFGKTL